MFRFVTASEIESEALADFRSNDSGDRLAPQAQKTKSLLDDNRRNASMRGGVQREVSVSAQLYRLVNGIQHHRT